MIVCKSGLIERPVSPPRHHFHWSETWKSNNNWKLCTFERYRMKFLKPLFSGWGETRLLNLIFWVVHQHINPIRAALFWGQWRRVIITHENCDGIVPIYLQTRSASPSTETCQVCWSDCRHRGLQLTFATGKQFGDRQWQIKVGQGERKTPNMNKFGGLSRNYVGGEELFIIITFMCSYFRLMFDGR